MVVREVTALQHVAHPHVVGFHGGFLRDGGFCFALEYMDAGCLLDLYQAVGCLRDDRVLASVAKQVLLALRYLHKDRKVMHRDLKPTNLLLNRSVRCAMSTPGPPRTRFLTARPPGRGQGRRLWNERSACAHNRRQAHLGRHGDVHVGAPRACRGSRRSARAR